MADKARITSVIDSIEERLPDNDRGWGKYRLYLEGHKGLMKVDVPAELNAEFDLQEGYVVTLVEGPFKGWIASGQSECFTGKQAQPDRYKEPRGESGRGGYGDGPEDRDSRPAPRRAAPKRDSGGYGERKSSRESAPAKTKSGGHTAWNEYNISVRDPQMRMQTLLKLSVEVNTFCAKNDLDPREMMNDIIEDAKLLDEAVIKHLGL